LAKRIEQASMLGIFMRVMPAIDEAKTSDAALTTRLVVHVGS
jgi:hypothetical protein